MPLVGAISALPVTNIEAATTFYRDRLGFTVGYNDESFGVVERDEIEIHLWASSDERWRESRDGGPTSPVVSGAESFLAGTASCRIEVRGIDELYLELERAGVLYDSKTTVEVQPWGTREFAALDLERNLLTFFERK